MYSKLCVIVLPCVLLTACADTNDPDQLQFGATAGEQTTTGLCFQTNTYTPAPDAQGTGTAQQAITRHIDDLAKESASANSQGTEIYPGYYRDAYAAQIAAYRKVRETPLPEGKTGVVTFAWDEGPRRLATVYVSQIGSGWLVTEDEFALSDDMCPRV